MKSRIGVAISMSLVTGVSAAALGQFIGKSTGGALPKTPPVQFLYPEQVHVAAGKPAPVILHFRIIEGMHINSHTPHDDFLIPTKFSIPGGEGVRLESAKYPVGNDISLPSAPNMELNVYSGEFTIDTRMMATPGNHLVKGTLHFQACNMSQCLPPQTIMAAIDVVAK